MAIDPKVDFSLLSFWSERKGGGLYFSSFLGECFPGKSFLAWQILLLLLLSNIWLYPPLSLAVCSMLGSPLLKTLGPLYCFFSQYAFWSLFSSLSSDDLLDSGLLELLLGRLLTFHFPVLGECQVCLVRLLTILIPHCELFLGLKLHLARVFRDRVLDRWFRTELDNYGCVRPRDSLHAPCL